MNGIFNVKVIESHSVPVFESKLWDAVHKFQQDGLEVELQYDAEKAYTCLVIAREAKR